MSERPTAENDRSSRDRAMPRVLGRGRSGLEATTLWNGEGGVSECGCTWDPEYHRDLNIRRGRPEAGSTCTNPVYPESYGAQAGICAACLFGCAE